VGGYSWTWDFVEGLEEGESDMDKIDNAKTSARIKVKIDKGNCTIDFGGEQCAVCSVSDCGSDLKTISYDCTNLENGKSSGEQCEVFADPFFFPFNIAATIAPTKALRGTISGNEEDETISETISTSAALMDPEVKCLEESPEVCIGVTYQTGPSPKVICDDPADSNSCRTKFVGGYSWTWDFVEGLEEGESDMDKIDNAKTSARIKVKIDKGNCTIDFGGEQCAVCSVSDCGSDLKTISYDCTNLENGKSSGDQCEVFADPFFYPLKFNVTATLTPTSNAIGKTMQNGGEGTISETISEPSSCPNDIKLVSTVGATKYQDRSANPDVYPAVKIVSQDTSTVSVNLTQAWASSTINNYFYEYNEDTFDTKCYEKVDLQGQGTFIDSITIQCAEAVSYASLRICLQDATGELLGPDDNATVPKCCHSDAPKETPTVCYNLEISCVPQCGGSTGTLARRGLGSDSGKEKNSLSRFDLPSADIEVSKIPYAASIELNTPNGIHGDILIAPGFMVNHGGWINVLLTGAALAMTVL